MRFRMQNRRRKKNVSNISGISHSYNQIYETDNYPMKTKLNISAQVVLFNNVFHRSHFRITTINHVCDRFFLPQNNAEFLKNVCFAFIVGITATNFHLPYIYFSVVAI